MSVFNTERPSSYEQKLNALKETAQVRKRNMNILKENAQNEEYRASMESVLNDMDKADTTKDSISKEFDMDKLAMNRNNKLASLSGMKLESKLEKAGYNKCLETAIFQIIYEGFWADDNIKAQTVNSMLECYRNTVDILEKLEIPKNKKSSKLIDNIKKASSDMAKKVSKRITKEACEDGTCKVDDIDTIDFTLNDDESIELDDNLASLGIDDISKLVKSKVLSVINDEQEASIKKAEIFKDIDDNTVKLGDDTTSELDGETTKESAFVSMVTRANNNRVRRLTGTSLFECIMIHSTRNVENNIVEEGVKTTEKDTMDAAFMESVLTYTVLETLQTLKLYDFNNSTVKTLREYYKAN